MKGKTSTEGTWSTLCEVKVVSNPKEGPCLLFISAKCPEWRVLEFPGVISHSLPWSEVEPLLSYWPDLGHLLTPEIKGESQPPAHHSAGTGEGAKEAE